MSTDDVPAAPPTKKLGRPARFFKRHPGALLGLIAVFCILVVSTHVAMVVVGWELYSTDVIFKTFHIDFLLLGFVYGMASTMSCLYLGQMIRSYRRLRRGLDGVDR